MISPATIERVRDRADIVAVISETVPSLKRRGRSFVGLCPFHKEKSPSFHVNPDRGFFHCFGCKESGSVIDFVMKQEGATFPEAVRSLAERYNIEIEEDRGEARPEQDRLKKLRDDLYAVNAAAATFWEEELNNHEHAHFAHEELKKRGIPFGQSDEIDLALKSFRMGYAPSGWDGLATYFRKQGISPYAAEQVGLLVPRSQGGSHYDRFRHRLMFAVVDEKGRVVAFSGRALPPPPGDAEQKESPAKYMNSPESPIYTKGHTLFGLHQARHAIRAAEEAILVEGNFDVVSLHARGIQNVVAPLGTAFTSEQSKLLRRFASRVVLSFDGDSAGKKATRAAREAIATAGLSARVLRIPEGKDPDDVVRTRGAKGFLDALSGAKEYTEHLIDEALDSNFTSASAMEKAARLDEVMKLIGAQDNPLVRLELKSLADKLAARLDLHGLEAGRDHEKSSESFRMVEQMVRRQLATERQTQGPIVTPRDARIAPKTPGTEERKAIAQALIECPDLLVDPDVEGDLQILEGKSVEVVLALRKAWNFEQGKLDVDAFLGALPQDLLAWAKTVLAQPALFDQKEAKEYLRGNAEKLKRLLLGQSANELARENYRAQGDWDEEAERAREAADRMYEKHGVKR
jgi:DNA primase